ncbi:hypothetical protein K445DRAFT_86213 [Daldinia sp. EC12]|nr:hypothetical protein K445DRAFT_86213 [Daldinia sp. EC12]
MGHDEAGEGRTLVTLFNQVRRSHLGLPDRFSFSHGKLAPQITSFLVGYYVVKLSFTTYTRFLRGAARFINHQTPLPN